MSTINPASRSPRDLGFTLVELLVVVAIIAIIMAIVIPGLLRARIGANETSALATLRSFATAQEQFRGQQLVDVDGDGAGEYGWLSELAGVEQYRVKDCLLAGPALPSFVPSSFGTSLQNTAPDFFATHSGYAFRVFLPGATGAIDGIPEAIPLPCDLTHADAQEQRFVIYAWPMSLEVTGNRAFFVNQRAELYFKANVTGARWNNTASMPLTGNEALAIGETNLDGHPPGFGVPSQDGELWMPR